jgi:hypothetical protein
LGDALAAAGAVTLKTSGSATENWIRQRIPRRRNLSCLQRPKICSRAPAAAAVRHPLEHDAEKWETGFRINIMLQQ